MFDRASDGTGFDSASDRPAHATFRIPLDRLQSLADEYFLDCEYRKLKPHTIRTSRCIFDHFFWYLSTYKCDGCGRNEIKQFLHYIQTPQPEGRWGNPKLTEAVRPTTARDYYKLLRIFFNWMLDEEIITVNPMRKIKAPAVPRDLKQPLNERQVVAMMQAAKKSPCPARNEAILLFLFDTGVRAAELCGLKMKDLDLPNRSATILGKGNKIRTAYFDVSTAKAIARYLRNEKREADDPVFESAKRGGHMTPSGLHSTIREIGEIAGVKCGVHDWRRTNAVFLLRNGANLVGVQRLLGHESIEVTQGYLNLAMADVETQHRMFSPASKLRR